MHAHPEEKWKEKIIAQLAHYKRKARYFDEINQMVSEILFSSNEQSIAAINFATIYKVMRVFGYKEGNYPII